MNAKNVLGIVIVLVVGLFLGWLRSPTENRSTEASDAASEIGPQSSEQQATSSASVTENAKNPVIGEEWTVLGLSLEMKWIPVGSFKMGSPNHEVDRDEDEGVLREVTITHGFWLGVTEVTQGQWKAIMGSTPSHFPFSDRRPVEMVAWSDAMRFCEKLNSEHGSRLPEGYRFTLPTEAEWEYACRAGTTTRFFCGDDHDELVLHDYAWYHQEGGASTKTVATKEPNPWGLFDMHGNVYEWVFDWYGMYPVGNSTDPQGPTSGSVRIARGGSWYNTNVKCRSANRERNNTDGKYNEVGFRIAIAKR